MPEVSIGRFRRFVVLPTQAYFRSPAKVVATIGVVGFLIDMFWKPINNAGLILLGLAMTPWLTRLIKSAKVAGVEFVVTDTQTPEAVGAKLEAEADRAMEDGEQVEVHEGGDQAAEAVEADEQAHEVAGTGLGPQVGPEEGSDASDADATPTPSPANRSSLGRSMMRRHFIRSAFLAETLVLQELQRETGGVLQRDVRLGTGRDDGLDAILTTPTGTVGVQVKLTRSDKNAQNILRDAAFSLIVARPKIPPLISGTKPRLILAWVLEGPTTVLAHMTVKEITAAFPGVELRLFSLDALARRYGVPVS